MTRALTPELISKSALDETVRKQDEATRQEKTVGDAWAVYLEAKRPPGEKKWSERHYNDHLELSKAGGEPVKFRGRKGAKIKPGPLAALMPLKLSELTPETVKAWAEKEAAERKARTRLAFSLLRAFTNWCEESSDYKGLISPDACGTRVKKDVITRQKPKGDCLQKEQLSAWFSAVRGLSNPTMAAYLQTLLLTGARRNELASLRWKDIDFKWDSLTIHDKVEDERTIPLTPFIKSLLKPLPKRNDFVFSSPRSKSGRLEDPRIPHNRALAVAGIDHLTLHGLRRSFGTLSEWVEMPAGIVAQLMGHKPSATAEKHYRIRPLDLLRKWHVKIEDWILEQAGIEQPQNNETGLRVVKK